MRQGTFKHLMLSVATTAANHIRNKCTETQNILGTLQKDDTEYDDLMYHKKVRWLIQERATQHFDNSSSEVLPFLQGSKILFFRNAIEITSNFSCKALTTHQLENNFQSMSRFSLIF